MSEMYDNPDRLTETFDSENLTKELREAQKSEFRHLLVVMKELSYSLERPLRILDIGVGDGRVLQKIHSRTEDWELVDAYHGIDIADNCVSASRTLIADLGIQNAFVGKLDACDLSRLKNQSYDLVICTWFTAGNLYPDSFNFENFNHDFDLTENVKFTRVFKQAYERLNSGGEVVIGSAYLDNEPTRKKQEEAYRHFGWKVITDQRDSFTAAENGWWSQRFTPDLIRSYLNFAPPENINFIPLDNEEYAVMVRIKKV